MKDAKDKYRTWQNALLYFAFYAEHGLLIFERQGKAMLWEDNYLAHFGVKGMKWGVRKYADKYVNPDGTLNARARHKFKVYNERMVRSQIRNINSQLRKKQPTRINYTKDINSFLKINAGVLRFPEASDRQETRALYRRKYKYETLLDAMQYVSLSKIKANQ